MTWWTVLRIAVEERLIYRADFALGTLMRFLPIVTQIFLWGAIFQARKLVDHRSATIAGYSYDNFIAYYLLTMVTRAFSSMPGLASGIARDIREGTIKKYLIQPIDMLGFLLLTRTAHKLVYYTVAAAPFALVFYLCRGYFPGWPDAGTIIAFLLSLLLSFLLGYLLECIIGMIGFWFLEVSSLVFIFMLFSFFFSGQMFPLDMLPGAWGHVVKAVPLQYLAYFSANVLLGKITGPELVRGLWIEAGWVVCFFVVARLVFHFGVRRYSGYGG
jgi:ABC-2 type transport system permease protein